MINTSNKKGFSLIEILVGIAIVITATTIVLSIIVSSFRISGKATSNEIVRQNGNYIMAQMTRIIQFGDSFQGAGNYDSEKNLVVYDKTCAQASYHYLKIRQNGVDSIITCTDSDIKINGQSSLNSNININTGCELTCSLTRLRGANYWN
jgi:type II secretory pathway pseudopilin PulG